MYSSSKWPCVFTLLLFRLEFRCSNITVSSELVEDQEQNYSFVVNVCLQVDKRVQLSSGVLISRKRILTACRPYVYVKSTAENSQVVLPHPDHFRVWAGQAKETGQWRDVEKFYCVDTPVAPPHFMGNDLGILIVQDEFELADSVIGFNELINNSEMEAALTFRTMCKIVTWSVKFKEKHKPDLEKSLMKECLVETMNSTSCAAFLSAEVTEISNTSLVEGSLMCVLPLATNEEPCYGNIVPGSPVMCSKKLIGIVSLLINVGFHVTIILVLIDLHSLNDTGTCSLVLDGPYYDHKAHFWTLFGCCLDLNLNTTSVLLWGLLIFAIGKGDPSWAKAWVMMKRIVIFLRLPPIAAIAFGGETTFAIFSSIFFLFYYLLSVLTIEVITRYYIPPENTELAQTPLLAQVRASTFTKNSTT